MMAVIQFFPLTAPRLAPRVQTVSAHGLCRPHVLQVNFSLTFTVAPPSGLRHEVHMSGFEFKSHAPFRMIIDLVILFPPSHTYLVYDQIPTKLIE